MERDFCASEGFARPHAKGPLKFDSLSLRVELDRARFSSLSYVAGPALGLHPQVQATGSEAACSGPKTSSALVDGL